MVYNNLGTSGGATILFLHGSSKGLLAHQMNCSLINYSILACFRSVKTINGNYAKLLYNNFVFTVIIAKIFIDATFNVMAQIIGYDQNIR